MKTAVDTLYEEMHRIRLEDECGNLGAMDFFRLHREAFKKAKKMEREQMADAFYAPANIDDPKTFNEFYKQKYKDEGKSNIR